MFTNRNNSVDSHEYSMPVYEQESFIGNKSSFQIQDVGFGKSSAAKRYKHEEFKTTTEDLDLIMEDFDQHSMSQSSMEKVSIPDLTVGLPSQNSYNFDSLVQQINTYSEWQSIRSLPRPDQLRTKKRKHSPQLTRPLRKDVEEHMHRLKIKDTELLGAVELGHARKRYLPLYDKADSSSSNSVLSNQSAEISCLDRQGLTIQSNYSFESLVQQISACNEWSHIKSLPHPDQLRTKKPRWSKSLGKDVEEHIQQLKIKNAQLLGVTEPDCAGNSYPPIYASSDLNSVLPDQGTEINNLDRQLLSRHKQRIMQREVNPFLETLHEVTGQEDELNDLLAEELDI